MADNTAVVSDYEKYRGKTELFTIQPKINFRLKEQVITRNLTV